MSLTSSNAKLTRAAKDLRRAWLQARSHWRDARASAFERKYVHLLDACMKTALAGISHMDGMLSQARSDCR